MIRPVSIFLKILLLGLLGMQLYADQYIIIQLCHLPPEEITSLEDDFFKDLSLKKIERFNQKSPSSISRKQLKLTLQKLLTPKLSNVAAVYAGYRDISNPDGKIMLPLRHTAQKLYIAITPLLNLVGAKGNSIAHREYASDDVVIYECTKQQDPKSQVSFWQVKHVSMPSNRIVNPLTVVLLSKPENIIMREGDFPMAESSGHLIMPPLYVISNSEQEELLLRSLSIGNYFEPVMEHRQKVGDVSVQIAISNN